MGACERGQDWLPAHFRGASTFLVGCRGLGGGDTLCPSSWCVEVSMDWSSGVALLLSTETAAVGVVLEMELVEADRRRTTGFSSDGLGTW